MTPPRRGEPEAPADNRDERLWAVRAGGLGGRPRGGPFRRGFNRQPTLLHIRDDEIGVDDLDVVIAAQARLATGERRVIGGTHLRPVDREDEVASLRLHRDRIRLIQPVLMDLSAVNFTMSVVVPFTTL